ncbi:MAG: protein kinase [Acidobacteriota bacterium]
MTELGRGSRLGPYEIVGTLGTGGLGQVFRARDTRLERDVAIKVLSPALMTDDAARARVHTEAVVLAKLKHRNIAHLYDVLTIEGTEALVMELVEGPTLAEKLREGALPEAEVVRLGIQLGEGLAAAHAEGIVHCDLKPANLKLPPGGDLRILDFGIARLRRAPEANAASVLETLTSTAREVAGTLPYMAPEQLRAESLDARTDIWAAGVVLCELATGRRPFEDTVPARLTDAILHAEPTATAPGASTGFRKILRKCLRKAPAERYQTAALLGADLAALSGTAPTRDMSTPTVAGPHERRRRIAVTGGLLVIGVVALAALWRGGWLRGGTGSRIDSLAVLPLSNISKDPEQEYFADGMTEAVISELSRIKALKVISRTSAMKYKNAKETLPQIAKALGVKGVVEGSVMRDGNTVRITVQLIDAATDRHLWTESYTREDRNVLALQSEVASAIAREVRVAVSPEERNRLSAERPVDPEAHRLVLLGTYAMNQSLTQRAGIEKGAELFRKAIEADPKFALAHLRLAMAVRWGGYAGYQPMLESCAATRVEAERAIDLDPAQGEAFALLSSLRRTCDFDWVGAEKDSRRALELSPGSAAVHSEAAYLATVLGRHEDAIRESRIAEQLDPLSEEIGVFSGMRLANARRFEDSVQQLRKVLGTHPDSVFAKFQLGNSLTCLGRFDEAIATFLSRKVPDPGANFALGLTYGLSGRGNEARKVLATLLEKRKTHYLPPTQIALVYAGLGEKETAWTWLKQAWDERAWLTDEMGMDPLFDAFRADPRFTELLRKMNLPYAR